MKDTSTTILIIAVAGMIGVAGFFAGTHMASRQYGTQFGYGQSMMGGRSGGYMMGGQGQNGFKRGGVGMMGSQGSITKINGNTVTLTLPDGTTRDVTLSDQTTVNTMTKGKTGDLKVGQNIMITGGGFWNGTQTVIVKP